MSTVRGQGQTSANDASRPAPFGSEVPDAGAQDQPGHDGREHQHTEYAYEPHEESRLWL